MPLTSSRTVQAEAMDRPELDPDAHRLALRGLERINRHSGVVAWYWRHLQPILQDRGQASLLDIGGGGGDVPAALMGLADRHGWKLHVSILDQSPIALQMAQQRCGPAATVYQADATSDDRWPPPHDVVVSSLFFHHLPQPQAAEVLQRMKQKTVRLLLVDDLRRCWSGYLAAWIGCRVLSRSKIVHNDGPISVRNGWSETQLRDLCRQAGLTGAMVRRRFPWRISLIWRPAATEL